MGGSIYFNSGGELVEIKIRDASLAKTGTWKFNAADKEKGNRILSFICQKYGFTPKINPPQKEGNDFLDMDVNW